MSPEEISLQTIKDEEDRAYTLDPETNSRLEHDFDIKIPEDAKVQQPLPSGKLLFDGQNCYMLVQLGGEATKL